MTEQITLQQALELVDFDQLHDGSWYVKTVKGVCITVKGHCGTVTGSVNTVKGSCRTVEGYCNTVEGNCGVVEGHVLGTINGRQWQFVETPKEEIARLIREDASKEELLEVLEKLHD